MLNETLFRILQHTFGQNVKIAKAGQPAIWRLEKTGFGDATIILDYGETYRVCCPFCAKKGDPDKRHRLWISHIYGTKVGKFRCWSAATCFHNDCLKDEFAKDELRNWISGLAISRRLSSISFPSGAQVETSVPELPGTCLKLSELPPKHKAIYFLTQKGFDPAELEEKYSVCYCVDSDQFPLAIDRIVFPITYQGKRTSWQCRYVGVPKNRNIPKYFSAKNIKQNIFNIDRAIQQPYIVLVEGVFDAIRVGDSGAALFGKTLSTYQAQLLRAFRGSVIVFLDPDATEEALVLEKAFSPTNPVHTILNAKNDPGKLGSNEVQEYISMALSARKENHVVPHQSAPLCR